MSRRERPSPKTTIVVKTKKVSRNSVPGDTRCATCGRRADNHQVRHPFTIVAGLATDNTGEPN